MGHAVVFFSLVQAVFCLAACAGIGSGADFKHALERRIAERMLDGEAALSKRIAAVVEANALNDIRAPNAIEAARAALGEIRVASAAWWGWDPEIATDSLNAALAAPIDVLIVPAMESPWLVGPLFVTGPKTVLFEPGCVIAAAEGEFLGKNDCLITIRNQSNVELVGYGSRLLMRKDDYGSPPYEPSQWRHAVALLGSRSIDISGFSIEKSGGDGIYVGQKAGEAIPSDISLRDLAISGNHRQGVSVISARNLVLSHSIVTGTSGHAPQAGIDFEPNRGVFGFQNCRVTECVFENNAGSAVHIHLDRLTETHQPIDIRIDRSAILGKPVAVWINGLRNGASGTVTFDQNTIRGLRIVGRSDRLSTIIR